MASSTSDRRRRPSAILVALLAAVATATAATPAAAWPMPAHEADPARREAARAKLVEGVDALKAGDHRIALQRFEEAYALFPSANIHYNFALAYQGLGRIGEAVSAYQSFVAEALDAPPDKRLKAVQQVTALRPRVGAVAVKGAPDGATIVADGREVGSAPLPRPLYLDPGPHEIAVRHAAQGAPASVKRVDVTAGASLTLVFDVAPPSPASPIAAPPPAAAAPVPAAPAPAVAARRAPDMRVRRIVAISSGAAGAGLLVTSVVFGVLAKRAGDSLTRDSENGQTPPAVPFDPDKESRGLTYEKAQLITLVLGAIGVATGVALYATSRGRVTVEPVVARSGAGANFQLTF
jgi:hypothetical protein